MPARLRPTAPIATDAILVGDPGRALLLAQELLEQPKMSNHARGLWGYSGIVAEWSIDPRMAGSIDQPAARELTIQSVGIGGPSAALVLGELAGLGLKRAVRVGTCVGAGDSAGLGALLVVGEAVAAGGSAAAHGLARGKRARPDSGLTARLERACDGDGVLVASFDVHPRADSIPAGAVAAEMQTASLLAAAGTLGVAAAALLIVAESAGGEHLETEALAEIEKRAGRAALLALSS